MNKTPQEVDPSQGKKHGENDSRTAHGEKPVKTENWTFFVEKFNYCGEIQLLQSSTFIIGPGQIWTQGKKTTLF